jgi:hypothetical protein
VVGETRSFVGNLVNAFDFKQDPLPPLILPTSPLPGPASCVDGVVCPSPDPTVTSVSPNLVQQGATNLVATVTGTGFTPDSSIEVVGLRLADLVKTTTTYLDSTHLRITMTAKDTIGQSPYDVDVRSPDGRGSSCWDCLTVVPAPRLTSASPTTLAAGTSATVTIHGHWFVPGATLTGPGVKVRPLTVIDDQTATAKVSVLAHRNPGYVRLTLTDPASAGGGSAVCTTCLATTA